MSNPKEAPRLKLKKFDEPSAHLLLGYIQGTIIGAKVIYPETVSHLEAIKEMFMDYAGLSGRPHIESPDCWCSPKLSDDFTSDGGTKHYVHNEEQ